GAAAGAPAAARPPTRATSRPSARIPPPRPPARGPSRPGARLAPGEPGPRHGDARLRDRLGDGIERLRRYRRTAEGRIVRRLLPAQTRRGRDLDGPRHRPRLLRLPNAARRPRAQDREGTADVPGADRRTP